MRLEIRKGITMSDDTRTCEHARCTGSSWRLGWGRMTFVDGAPDPETVGNVYDQLDSCTR